MKSKKIINRVILITLLIALACIVWYKYYVYAADISTYMSIHNNEDTYIELTQAKINARLGKTVGYPNTSNDYTGYVLPNPRMWCLSEKKTNNITSGHNLVIKAIAEIGIKDGPDTMDVNPTKALLHTASGTSSRTSSSKSRLRAGAAFAMYAGKNPSNDYISGIAQKYFIRALDVTVDNHAFSSFYESGHKGGNTSARRTVYGSVDTQAEYVDAIDSLEVTVKNSDIESSVFEHKSGTHKGYSYGSRITTIRKDGGEILINLQKGNGLVSSRRIYFTLDNGTVKQNYIGRDGSYWYIYSDEELSNKVGKIIATSGNIYLKDGFISTSRKITNVRVQVYYRYIHAALYYLDGPYVQTRGVSVGEIKIGSVDGNFNVTGTTGDKDFSIQKYVAAVGSSFSSNKLGGTIRYGYNRDRSKLKATTKSNTEISLTATVDDADLDYTKHDNPVRIVKGDSVVYRVIIYNNGEDKGSIRVKERIEVHGKLLGVYQKRDSDTGEYQNKLANSEFKGNDDDHPTKGSFSNLNNSYYQVSENGEDKYYQWESAEIDPGDYKVYYVVVQYQTYSAGRILNKAFVNDSKNKTEYRTSDFDYLMMQTNMSLDKQVVAVGSNFQNHTLSGTGGTADYYGYNTSRQFVKAKSNSPTNIFASDNKGVQDFGRNTATNTTPYKSQNPVQIETDSYVVYKVTVYNNSDYPNYVDVRDRLSIHAGFVGLYTSRVSGTLQFGNKVREDDYETGIINDTVYGTGQTAEHDYIQWQVTVAANSYNSYWIVVKYKNLIYEDTYGNPKRITEVIDNKAYIDCNWNVTSYQTTDYDYVKLADHSVSLEKFIYKVTNKNGGDASYPSGREGKRYNESAANNNNGNKNTDKVNSPVALELGDKVTFRIKLTNTGTTPIRVKSIYDTYIYGKGNDPKNGVHLVYDSSGGIKGKYTNGNACTSYDGTITNSAYANPGNAYGRYLITFNNATDIAAGASIYVEIRFTVENLYRSNVSEELWNKAGIVEIQNKFGRTVSDDDGNENNYDMDYMKTKVYKVNLEKYVCKVQNADASWSSATNAYSGRAGHPEYNPAGYNKSGNPVMLEKGDRVTFRIIVRNIGENTTNYGNVKSFVITDPAVDGLEYLSRNNTTNVTANSTNTQFTYAGNIIPGTGSFTLELTYRVTKQVGLTQVIKNTATVSTGLTNKNDIPVTDSDGSSNNTDSDYVRTKIYEVKLEKYVCAVNGSATFDPSNARKDHPIYNKNGFDKEKKPVLVNKGNTVTYKIKITNKGTNSTTHGSLGQIIIEDALPQYLDYGNPIVSGCTSGSVVYDTASSKIQWTGTLALNSSTEFNLTYKVKTGNNAPQGVIICNTATIKSLYNKNLSFGLVTDSNDPNPTDNADKDWIKIRVTAVAIEKYVSKVTSPMGTTTTQDDQIATYEEQRKDKRFNEYYNESYSNLGPKNNEYKKKNHVKIETGDIVTFKIKLQNTGELPLKIDQFYDSYSYYWSSSDYRYNSGLEYIEGSIKNVSPNSKISNITIDSQEYSKGSTEIGLRRYLINVGWNGTLAPMSEEEIELQFKVLSPIRGKMLMWNKVGIVKITDTYNNNFTWHIGTANFMAHNNATKEGDYDGPNNNYDMDYLESQEYRVSLQKVVTQILNSDTIIGDRWDSWESHANTCVCASNNNLCNNSSNLCSVCGRYSWYNIGCICAIYSEDCIDSNADQKCDNCNHDMKFADIKDNTGNKKVRCNHKDSQENEHLKYAKHNNPVPVVNGDFVRFAIRVRNDGDTKVKVTRIVEELPAGVELQYIEKMLPDGTNAMITENTTRNYNSINYDDNNLPVGEYIYDRTNNDVYIYPGHADIVLAPQETDTYYVTVKVTETNMSVDVMRNYAVLSWIRNKNDCGANDVTMEDNTDADYIQMKDIEISGVVWNDRALDKTQEDYNGMYDAEDENPLAGVTVKLYRTNASGNTLVAQKVTGEDGKYSFTRDDIATFNVVKHKCEQYIKGPYKCEDAQYTGTGTSATHSANYWAGTYYSYYVVFEYNGITYTSTVYTELVKDGQLNPEDINTTSNAREKEKASDSFDGNVVQSRTEFNDRYDTINSDGAWNKNGNHNKTLIYDTINKSGYIPSSVVNFEKSKEKSVEYWKSQGYSEEEAREIAYQDNTKTILMQSSTQKIGLAKNAEWEEKLQHVNIGLRGRDIFDLELTSDVAQVEVTVNKQKGVYKYENRVEIRESDILASSGIKQDTANIEAGDVREVGDSKSVMTAGVIEEYQDIRALDLNPDTVNTINDYKHEDGLQSIFVTYKITATNASQTNGVATKITNYYDKKYNFIGAYANLADAETRTNDPEFLLKIVEESDSNPNYNYKTIETKWDTMTQSESKDIYLVYELKPEQFANITTAGLETYNMAEITEYKTSLGEGQTEFTKGLVDKDSAPGSVNKEQVRTTDTEGQNTPTTEGNPTTVDYYFGKATNGYELDKLKYEDDTYATPTLYFRKVGNEPDPTNPNPDPEPDPTDPTNPDYDPYIRTIIGTVFEDLTKVHSTTKIKTGNGKLDEGEVGVYGARVQLIELSDGQVVRYETHTDKDGKFKFTGFLPGNYIIKYFYGDSSNTVLINQAEHNGSKVNAKSYNGEDFQSTNNSYDVAGMDTNKLNRTPNYWYLYNEPVGISTAIDDSARRLKVSENVTAFIDEQMEVLNNIRDGRANVDVSYTLDDGITTNTITIGTMADPDTSMNIIPKTYMFAETEQMLLTVEKSELVDDGHGGKTHIQKTTFDEYKITNMNFGIAEVPVSTVDLQKQVKELKVKDATGENVLIGLKKEADGWKTTGDVIPAGSNIDVQIENEQLQGAKLEVRFTISVDIDTEVNYDGTSCIVPKITAVADFVNNNLSYNADLSYEKDGSIIKNSTNWEVATHEKVKDILKEQKKYDLVTEPKGTVDPEGTTYTTVLIATPNNPLIGASEGYESVDIVLEKVLSSTELTIDEVITSTVDMSEYNNIVEIIGFDYITSAGAGGAGAGGAGAGGAGAGGAGAGGAGAGGAGAGGAGAGGAGAGGAGAGGAGAGGVGAGGVVETPIKVMRDRVRNPERYIILPGVQYDYASSETIVIHPPTGTTQIDTIYYVVAVIALGVLAAGVYGIKKFVIKK